MGVLVDSSVLIDVATKDPEWFAWSGEAIRRLGQVTELCVNHVIYAVAAGFPSEDRLEAFLTPDKFQRRPLPWRAAFPAGRAFLKYRRQGGRKRSPLPDFYVGAHALVEDLVVLTRDVARFKTYFPTVRLVSPENT